MRSTVRSRPPIGVRPTIRLRLTLLYAGLLVGITAVVLGVSWWVLSGHLHATLPEAYADSALDRLGAQYAFAIVGAGLLAVGLGWAVAGHALAPLRRIAATARRISGDQLDERVALQGPDDELRELAGVVDDMLERLEGAMESRRRFVANASHELRTPLTVIRTEAEVTLADPNATEADLRRMGQITLETTERMERLLDGLLVLARSTRVERQRRDPVDLGVLAERVAVAARAEADAHAVQVHLDAQPAQVVGDEPLLERLIANLVENAIRHNHPGGWADVRVDGNRVRVSNSGPIIPPESLALLGEPFQRLTRSAAARGSGLGLSIVRAVAESHGGALSLRARDGGGLEAEVALALTPH